MTFDSRPSFDGLLAETRSILQEEFAQENRDAIERLLPSCIEDPLFLHQRSSWKPRFVVWELTLRCNMRCAHCGSDAGTRRGEELNEEEVLSLSAQLGALGCERLTLLGGEPFIREDWEAITKALQDASVKVNVITNGWLTADRDFVQRVKDAGLRTLALSVDGFGKKHDEIRRKEGSFDRIIRSFEHANSIGDLPIAAVTTVTKMCIDDLDEMYRMLLDNGVRLWQMQVVTPLGRLDRSDPILPTSEDLLRLDAFIAEKQAEGKLRIDPADNVGYFGKRELAKGYRSNVLGASADYWMGCQAGFQVMGIEANGDIKGCLSLSSDKKYIEGNVKEESLEEIWWKPGAFSYNRDFKLDMLSGFCAECRYRGLCRGGCVSNNEGYTGNRGECATCTYMIEETGSV